MDTVPRQQRHLEPLRKVFCDIVHHRQISVVHRDRACQTGLCESCLSVLSDTPVVHPFENVEGSLDDELNSTIQRNEMRICHYHGNLRACQRGNELGGDKTDLEDLIWFPDAPLRWRELRGREEGGQSGHLTCSGDEPERAGAWTLQSIQIRLSLRTGVDMVARRREKERGRIV